MLKVGQKWKDRVGSVVEITHEKEYKVFEASNSLLYVEDKFSPDGAYAVFTGSYYPEDLVEFLED